VLEDFQIKSHLLGKETYMTEHTNYRSGFFRQAMQVKLGGIHNPKKPKSVIKSSNIASVKNLQAQRKQLPSVANNLIHNIPALPRSQTKTHKLNNSRVKINSGQTVLMEKSSSICERLPVGLERIKLGKPSRNFSMNQTD